MGTFEKHRRGGWLVVALTLGSTLPAAAAAQTPSRDGGPAATVVAVEGASAVEGATRSEPSRTADAWSPVSRPGPWPPSPVDPSAAVSPRSPGSLVPPAALGGSGWKIAAGAGFVVGAAATWAYLHGGGSTSHCDRDRNQDAMSSGECAGLTVLGGLVGAGVGVLTVRVVGGRNGLTVAWGRDDG